MLPYISVAVAAGIFTAFAIPASRTWLLIKLGIAKKDLSTLLGTLETNAKDLEAHALELIADATTHRETAAELTAKATAAETDATRAKTAAANIKTLIAV